MDTIIVHKAEINGPSLKTFAPVQANVLFQQRHKKLIAVIIREHRLLLFWDL